MSSQPNLNELECGTYVIRCAHSTVALQPLIMFCFPPTHFTSSIVPPPLQSPLPVTTCDLTIKWDVIGPPPEIGAKRVYTIEEHDEDEAFAAIDKPAGSSTNTLANVFVEKYSQNYNIVPVSTKHQSTQLYKIYLAGSKQVLKCNGYQTQVTVVPEDTVKTGDDQDWIKWSFEKANGPYESYGTYFRQDRDPSGNKDGIKVFPRFGLVASSDNRWINFWKTIEDLNAKGQGSTLYKVLFLGRHGEGVHNIAMRIYSEDQWLYTESERDGDGNLTWGPDAELTQEGCMDAAYVNSVWAQEDDAKIGLPDISYCSPLTRCLVTNTITFGPQVYGDDATKSLKTVVVENCRERCSKQTPEKRRTRKYITEMFRKFTVEDGFSDNDQLWSARREENPKDVRRRVRAVLDKIFQTESESKKFVSITTHSEFINCLLRVLCRAPYHVPAGGVLPLVCKYTPANANN